MVKRSLINMLLFVFNDVRVYILLTVMVVLLMCLFTFLLIKSIKKERVKFAEDKTKGKVDKQKLLELIKKKLDLNSKKPFCLIKIELNDILVENTSFVTKRNDLVYKAVSERIISVLGEFSKIAKDDDGGLLIYNAVQSINANLNAHCKFLCSQLSKPIVLSNAFTLSISFNIAAVKFPQSENTVEALLKNLDMALAAAKRKGVNTYAVNSAEIEMQNTEEYRYFRELKSAIEKKEFLLYYQPVIDLSKGKVIGFESLIRWNHSSLGVLSPASFLRILEQTGDINWVGFWAFERFLENYKELLSLYQNRQFMMFMNLSNRQLNYNKLTEEFKRMLKKLNVNPQNICFDISEADFYNANLDMKKNIEALRMLGFKIAIDNLGLEASSLTRLEKSEVSAIKLDKNVFEEAGEEGSISKNILAILAQYAKERNILLISLGIENMSNIDFAAANGINFGQGYYFAPPKPFDDAKVYADIDMFK